MDTLLPAFSETAVLIVCLLGKQVPQLETLFILSFQSLEQKDFSESNTCINGLIFTSLQGKKIPLLKKCNWVVFDSIKDFLSPRRRYIKIFSLCISSNPTALNEPIF